MQRQRADCAGPQRDRLACWRKMTAMTVAELLTEAFERIHATVHRVLDGAGAAELTTRAGGTANPIGWLIWHLARVQDDHLAGVAGCGQVWTADGWQQRFALPYAADATGYAHTSAEVDAFAVPSGDLLIGYVDAVHAVTLEYVGGLCDADLDRVVDEGWDPPVTLGARLVSVIADDLQHVGQAAFARGVVGG